EKTPRGARRNGPGSSRGSSPPPAFPASAAWIRPSSRRAPSGTRRWAPSRATLERLCRDTLFQPQSADVPVQVLGVLESAGLAFDCLWVSGLSDEAWPLDARPNPFVPVALQKQAGVPQASAEGSLELDRRITQGWLGAADEVVLSHFEREEDRELAPSALILGVPKGEVAIPL